MSKFTKGEWYFDDYREVDGSVRVVKGNIIISYHGHCTDEDVANAHLIAAAPDMYKQLLRIKRAIENMPICDSYLYDIVEKEIEPLLTKARGE